MRALRTIHLIQRSTFLTDQKHTGEASGYGTQFIGLATLIATSLTMLLTMQGLTMSILSF